MLRRSFGATLAKGRYQQFAPKPTHETIRGSTTALSEQELTDAKKEKFKKKSDWYLTDRARAVQSATDAKSDHTIKLTFNDSRFAFRSKRTRELIRASLCFKLFSIEHLVENNMHYMNLFKNTFGESLFNLAMKMTVYGQFVAGEDKEKIKPLVKRMDEVGVGSILDYAVEEDLDKPKATQMEMDSCVPEEDTYQKIERYQPQQKFADRRVGVVSARTYFYEDEEQCDKNMENFLYCIEAAGGASKHGFAAIKLTALGRPQFLLQFSEALMSSRELFEQLAGAHKVDDENSAKSVLEMGFDEQRFYDKAGRMGVAVTRQDIIQQFTFMIEEADGYIDMLDWNNLLDKNKKIADIFTVKDEHGNFTSLMKRLTEDEEAQMKRMLERIDILANAAKENGVRLMIDAEQTYFQPAISRLTMEMMRKFNTESPIIFNTYQCYLKQGFNNFVIDVEQARRENFYFGAKIVRGAYADQERARAAELGYPDPIQVDYEATGRCYHRVMDVGLEFIHTHGTVNLMIASHNIDSIKYAISRMDSLNIQRDSGEVFFGQLLGMCDQVTFPLGQAGYSVYKYVPFGPVNEVLPYLSRRAQENRSLLDGVKNERKMLFNEICRRLARGKYFLLKK